MYCRNCGHRVEEEDLFCDFCGKQVRYKKSAPLIDLKNMPKGIKRAFFSLILLLVILLVGVSLYDNVLSEEAIIKSYIKSYVKGDYETVIKLSGIKNNNFINAKNIKEKYNSKNNKKVIIKNITENSNKRGEYNRTVTYLVDGVKTNTTLTLKKAGKRFFLFNDYVITSNDFIAKNVLFTVPKSATLMIDNVSLNDKYIEKSTQDIKTYKVESLLRKNVKITIKLKNNLTLCDIRSVFTNEEVDYQELNYNILDENTTIKLNAILKKAILSVLESGIENKDFSSINDSKIFTESYMEDELFKENYDKIKEKYHEQVSDFRIDEIKIENLELDENSKMIVRVKFDYSYKSSEKGKRENTRTINMTLDDKLLIEDFYTNNLLYMF